MTLVSDLLNFWVLTLVSDLFFCQVNFHPNPFFFHFRITWVHPLFLMTTTLPIFNFCVCLLWLLFVSFYFVSTENHKLLHRVTLTSNMTGATSGAGTTYPSRDPELPLFLLYLWFSVFYYPFLRLLSVLWITASDYPLESSNFSCNDERLYCELQYYSTIWLSLFTVSTTAYHHSVFAISHHLVPIQLV